MDGLGKCSLGIRPAGNRRKDLSKEGLELARGFWRQVEVVAESMDKKERRRLLSRLALGQVEESPFGEAVVRIRAELDGLVKKLGKDPSIGNRVERSKSLGPDCQFLEGLVRRGVSLGVRGEIPLIPVVYDRKERAKRRGFDL